MTDYMTGNKEPPREFVDLKEITAYGNTVPAAEDVPYYDEKDMSWTRTFGALSETPWSPMVLVRWYPHSDEEAYTATMIVQGEGGTGDIIYRGGCGIDAHKTPEEAVKMMEYWARHILDFDIATKKASLRDAYALRSRIDISMTMVWGFPETTDIDPKAP